MTRAASDRLLIFSIEGESLEEILQSLRVTLNQSQGKEIVCFLSLAVQEWMSTEFLCLELEFELPM